MFSHISDSRVAFLLCLLALELMVFLVCFVCLFVCFFKCYFRFCFVYYYSNMYACLFFFFKISHSSIHSFIVHSLCHLSTFRSNLPAGHEKNEAVARLAEDRFTDHVIFSSKITFSYHPCFSSFRIFNKLNNITWKSVLSATSSPFSCQRSWGWGGFFLVSLLPCYLTWVGSSNFPPKMWS